MITIRNSSTDTPPTSPCAAGAGGPLSPPLMRPGTPPAPLIAARHFSSPSRSSAPTPSTRQMTPMSPTYDRLFKEEQEAGVDLSSLFPHPDFADPIKEYAAEGRPIITARPDPASYPQGLRVLTKYTNPDTYFFTSMPLEGVTPLGEGASAIVYPGNMVSVSATAAKVSQVAIAQLKPHHYNREAFTAIQALPPCPYLLARPIQIYESPDDPHVYITMPQLEGPDLFDRLAASPSISPKDRFKLLVTAFKHTSLGLAHLHNHGFVHRDSRLENMHPDGLFDYGALAKAGEWTLPNGADRSSCPPEPLATLMSEEGAPLFKYNRDFDVFVLGMQAVRAYGGAPPHMWPCVTPREKVFAVHITRMISLEPLERPPIEESVAFFTALKSSFDEESFS